MTRIQNHWLLRGASGLALNVVILWLLSATYTVGAQKATDTKVLGPITVHVPKGWVEKTPTGSMRKMQYSLPRAQSDAEDGEMAVFYFGRGQGGGVDQNIQRWIGQFTQPDGSPSQQKAKIEKRHVSGMPVTTLDIKGTYHAQSMMTPSPPQSKPGFRMIAAVVETPEGSYFFKLTGPEKTIAQWAGSFQQFINSIRKQ